MWIIAGIALPFLATWLLALVAALLVARPQGRIAEGSSAGCPRTRCGCSGSLALDRDVPRGARVRLWLLMAYHAIPLDLIPDFTPVLGHADDAIIAVIVLGSVVRRAGPEAIRRHWPGPADGLAALARAAA